MQIAVKSQFLVKFRTQREVCLTNAAAQGKVLGRSLNGSVAKEEGSCDDCTNSHRVLTSKELDLGEVCSDKRSDGGTETCDAVVSPSRVERWVFAWNAAADESSENTVCQFSNHE